jgi:hypothetical protein
MLPHHCGSAARRVPEPEPCKRHRLFGPWFCVDQQRVAAIVPSHFYFLVIRFDTLGPTVPKTAVFGESSFDDLNRGIRRLSVQHSLNAVLKTSGHRDIIRINAPTIVGEVALDIEDVAGTIVGEKNAPKAGIGRDGSIFRHAQPDERISPREDRAMRACGIIASLYRIPTRDLASPAGRPLRRSIAWFPSNGILPAPANAYSSLYGSCRCVC